jgi:DNA polymerase III epsilon subunit family exonuclease
MSPPDPQAPLADLEFVAFDTETTGLSPLAARLIELSGVKFRLDGRIISSFSQLIDPETDIPPDATAIHGITSQMVAGQPPLREVVSHFFNWLGGDEAILVAHNAPFDVGFLEIALARLSMPVPENAILDTLGLSRAMLPAAPNYQLRTLVEYLDLDDGGYHRALADSNHVRDLMIKLLRMSPHVTTWGDLVEICDTLSFTDVAQEGYEQLKAMPSGFEWIREAIDSGLTVRLVYRNGRTAARTVTPHSVHCWRGNVYLNGYCHVFHAERTFRLDKIIEFEILSE